MVNGAGGRNGLRALNTFKPGIENVKADQTQSVAFWILITDCV